MGALLQFSFNFETVTCCYEGCGIQFAFPKYYGTKRREDHAGWYCPNGHVQYFLGETEAQKLKKELERKEVQLKWANEGRDLARKERDRAQRKAAAYRGVITKTKARVGRGICPCCNRQFVNLQKHMAHLHPEYKKKGT